MLVNYAIRADVVDIQTDEPKNSDAFMVDSNVWFWTTYSSASTEAKPYQTKHYPNYLAKALDIGARVCRCGLSLAELASLIERTQWRIYCDYVQKIEAKEYRHNLPDERERIVSEVQAAWGQVKSMAESVGVEINDLTTDAALTCFQNQLVGGYDLFLLETMAREDVLQVITDDGDFATIPGIQVFTANRNVLNAARDQGRIITR
jgi:hypothetical protein